MRVAPSRVVHHLFDTLFGCSSVARAHLLTAALMLAKPHIRSPLTERLAPQSFILEVRAREGGSMLYCGISQPLFVTGRPPGSNAADQASWNS
jgi:hypothetical protein